MKKLAFLIALPASLFSAGLLAADLHIKAGSTYVIDSQKSKLSLDNLIIDDKANIQLARDVDLWVVDAKAASIGYGVVISGAGRDGRDGSDGKSHREATSCQAGRAGGDGLDGSSGTRGASVHWSMGIKSFGSVKVNLSGGRGGRGGAGGDGQNVPDFPNCTQAGGSAGQGGQGGSGGKGGSFRFHYTLEEGVLEDLTNSIEVGISGGLRGKGGQAGLAGVGTSGRYINKKTLSGSRSWVAGGGDGRQGETGTSGASGDNGSLDIRRINSAVAPAEAKPAEPEESLGDTEQRLKDLELLTQKLEARIRLLELNNQ